MSLKRPILALLAFVCLLAVYLWDVDHVERSRLQAVQKQQVFFHDPATVLELEFRNETGTVRLERPDGKSPWRVVQPSPMGANNVIVDAWLENLRGARRQAEFVPDATTQHGLDSPRAAVTLGQRGEGSSFVYTTLEFGAQPAAFGPVYARIKGEKTVFTVSEWFFKQARKSLADLRDKRIVAQDQMAFRKLEVRSTRGNPTIERANTTSNEWFTSSEGRPVPADRVIVDRVMGVLSEGQFLEVLDAPTSTTVQLGLEPPTLTVLADEKPILEVGMRIPGREQFVVRNGAGLVGIAGRSTVGEFFRPATEWTSKRLVWMPVDSISQVEVTSGNAYAQLLRDKSRWIFPDMPEVPVREDRVRSFLEALSSTSAARFIRANVAEDELRDFGIVPESFDLRVTDADGTVQGLRFGRTDTTEGLSFVWRRQDRSLWKIDFTAQGRLFKFRRDFEERRLIPELAARVGRIVVDIGPNQMVLEKKGAAWQGLIPNESPTIIPPAKISEFLEAFEELEATSEMALMGAKAPAASFQLFEPGSTEPFAKMDLMARNRQTRAGLFEYDGRVIEVDPEQFDVFDEAMASLVVAIKEQAEIGRKPAKP